MRFVSPHRSQRRLVRLSGILLVGKGRSQYGRTGIRRKSNSRFLKPMGCSQIWVHRRAI